MFENFRCSTAKKKVVVMRKRPRKKIVVQSPHTRGNASSVLALQRKPALDKKTAVKSRIQEILSGRSRFVIRKVAPAKGGAGDATSGGQEGGGDPSFLSRHEEEVKRDRYTCPLIFPLPMPSGTNHTSSSLHPTHTRKRRAVSTSPSCPVLQARLDPHRGGGEEGTGWEKQQRRRGGGQRQWRRARKAELKEERQGEERTERKGKRKKIQQGRQREGQSGAEGVSGHFQRGEAINGENCLQTEG